VLISHPNYTTAKKEANAGGKLLHGFVPVLRKDFALAFVGC
jgi:hypothetical protein